MDTCKINAAKQNAMIKSSWGLDIPDLETSANQKETFQRLLNVSSSADHGLSLIKMLLEWTDLSTGKCDISLWTEVMIWLIRSKYFHLFLSSFILLEKLNLMVPEV